MEKQEQPRPDRNRMRRSRAPGGRPHSVRVTLSRDEYAAVHQAAVRAGISDASWLGEAGVRVAAQDQPGGGLPATWGELTSGLMVARVEVSEGRRVLRNVGGNLNDIARRANTDGVLEAHTGRVLAMVERAVERVEQSVTALDELFAVARGVRPPPTAGTTPSMVVLGVTDEGPGDATG